MVVRCQPRALEDRHDAAATRFEKPQLIDDENRVVHRTANDGGGKIPRIIIKCVSRIGGVSACNGDGLMCQKIPEIVADARVTLENGFFNKAIRHHAVMANG